MKVSVVPIDPPCEFNAKFEGGVGLPQELVLVDPQLMIELEDRRDGRFADPNRSDRFRFDEDDPPSLASKTGKRRRRHPAGGAAAYNYDAPNQSSVIHCIALGLLFSRREAESASPVWHPILENADRPGDDCPRLGATDAIAAAIHAAVAFGDQDVRLIDAGAGGAQMVHIDRPAIAVSDRLRIDDIGMVARSEERRVGKECK